MPSCGSICWSIDESRHGLQCTDPSQNAEGSTSSHSLKGLSNLHHRFYFSENRSYQKSRFHDNNCEGENSIAPVALRFDEFLSPSLASFSSIWAHHFSKEKGCSLKDFESSKDLLIGRNSQPFRHQHFSKLNNNSAVLHSATSLCLIPSAAEEEPTSNQAFSYSDRLLSVPPTSDPQLTPPSQNPRLQQLRQFEEQYKLPSSSSTSIKTPECERTTTTSAQWTRVTISSEETKQSHYQEFSHLPFSLNKKRRAEELNLHCLETINKHRKFTTDASESEIISESSFSTHHPAKLSTSIFKEVSVEVIRAVDDETTPPRRNTVCSTTSTTNSSKKFTRRKRSNSAQDGQEGGTSEKNQAITSKFDTKNLVKNFLNQFLSFVLSIEEKQLIQNLLDISSLSELAEYQDQLKLFFKNKKYNRSMLKDFTHVDNFRKIFCYFLEHRANDWITFGRMKDKPSHLRALSNFIYICKNHEEIKSWRFRYNFV